MVVAATPRGDLRVDREAQDIRDKIHEHRRKGSWDSDADVHVELAASASKLENVLFERRPRAFHISCHHVKDSGQFTLEGGHGMEQQSFSYSQLADALRNAYRDTPGLLQLVVLNACETSDAAKRLVDEGVVLAAIGTSKPAPDDAAGVFACEFYAKLAVGETVSTSFEAAKLAMITSVKNAKVAAGDEDVDADVAAREEACLSSMRRMLASQTRWSSEAFRPVGGCRPWTSLSAVAILTMLLLPPGSLQLPLPLPQQLLLLLQRLLLTGKSMRWQLPRRNSCRSRSQRRRGATRRSCARP